MVRCPDGLALMRIKSNGTMFGYPVLQIRRLLRQAIHGISLEMVEHDLALDREAASLLLKMLEAEHYLEECAAGLGGWTTTIKGNAMAIASAGAPLQRNTAHRLLIDFLHRVEQVRDESQWLFKVETAVLFGSFLSDSTTLGDIDIALTMRPAHGDRAIQDVAETACRRAAQEGGRRFSNYVDLLFWPQQEVKRFLRSRRRISLHDQRVDGRIIETGPHVTIYANESVVKAAIPLLETWPL